MAKIASIKEIKGLRWYVLLCFPPSVLIKKSQRLALAVELEAATRFILSYPKWLAYRYVMVIRRGRLHRNICRAKQPVFVVPYQQPSYGFGEAIPQPLAIHLLALSSIIFTQLDGRSCGISCPTLLFSFIPDCCLIPHRIFELYINVEL